MESIKDVKDKKEIDVLELQECLAELSFICDNLTLVRFGLREGSCINEDIIDNGLYLIEQNLENVKERMEAAF